MKMWVKCLMLLCMVAAFAPKSAHAVSVGLDGAGTFRENLLQRGDTFTLTNTSDAGVRIHQVTIDMTGSNGSFFDPTSVAPGIASWSDFNVTSNNNAGFVPPPIGNTDGSQVLTLNFNDFYKGESFKFTIDVDKPGNAFVTGEDFEGAKLFVTFVGDGIGPRTLESTFDSEWWTPLAASANISRVEEPVMPEPATLLLVGTGLVGLIVRRKKSLK